MWKPIPTSRAIGSSNELNLIQAGRNYGWPLVSNGDNYSGPSIPDHPTRKEFQEPVRTWTPVISPSGAVFYKGSLFPALSPTVNAA